MKLLDFLLSTLNTLKISKDTAILTKRNLTFDSSLFSLIKMLSPKRILILGDKENSYKKSPSFSEKLDVFFKDQYIDIYKTDILFNNITQKIGNNIFEHKLDHTKKFDFPDNYFDFILGKNILCFCEVSTSNLKTCGGIDFSKILPIYNFIYEVNRVLNQYNYNAIAFIDGYENKEISEEENNYFNEKLESICFLVNKLRIKNKKSKVIYNNLKQKYRTGLYLGELDFNQIIETQVNFIKESYNHHMGKNINL